MTLPLFRLLNRLTFRTRSGDRARPRAYRAWHRPVLESLEDRTLLASSITVIAGAAGSGTLDSFLSATDGTITAADGGAVPGTLSTGALGGVSATTDISVTAGTSID